MYNHASCTLTINGIFPLILNTLVGNFVMILLYKYPLNYFLTCTVQNQTQIEQKKLSANTHKMAVKISVFQSLVFLFYRFILRRNTKSKYQKCPSTLLQSDLSRDTLIFNLERSLLKSDSLFPYFMLVAFEAGGVIRSFILFILYPLITLMLSHEMGVKVMVMVSFFGIKKDGFRAGGAVLPKHFLEDVGLEMFKVLRKGGKRIVVSYDLPQVMIEGFLRDYLEVEVVVGREMKVVGDYYLGIMEDKTKHDLVFDDLVRKEKLNTGRVIGITSYNTSLHRYLFSQFCQVRIFIYLHFFNISYVIMTHK